MPHPRSCDLFCRVVDNYGDVGVCWRLARELAAAPGVAVRMWVDDLASLRMLEPGAALDVPVQSLAKIEVHRWCSDFDEVVPADVVVEGFGSGLPDRYVEAMAARRPTTLWIVLEYLSAEPWVREHHGLPSPHPRLPLRRYFFFPGFEPGTGGLLREPDLFARRDVHDAGARRRYWRDMGFEPPPDDSQVIWMFAYPHAPLLPLMEHWSRGGDHYVVAISMGELATAAAKRFGLDSGTAGTRAVRGSLELRILPFIPQERFDEALWSADFLFVRGEDSFVRAQWAARPFVWHIYPQEQRTHWRKLEAFLDLYCRGMDEEAAGAVRGLWRAWNQVEPAPVTIGAAWNRYRESLPALQAHAGNWVGRLLEPGELAENLAEFCRDKLK
ncbi:MAG: elongation factor P maturation arginine rhamnosyltransferase EarP [Rhodospirillaceae bacterium]